MKFLFDFFPLLCFFLAFKWGEHSPAAAQALVKQYLSGLISGGEVSTTLAPMIVATVFTMIAAACQIGYLVLRRKKIDGMLWMSVAIIGIFGSATIYFHNDVFIKWKPTVLYWCFAIAFAGSQFVLKKNLIRSMMEEQVKLPERVWHNLSLAWIVFFVLMGFLNLYVAFTFSNSVWVNFKAFGSMGMMLVFVLAQSFYLSKFIEDAP